VFGNLVYTNKKSLRANPDGIFITENLTPYRTNLTKRLSQLKFDKQIAAYWTSDGRIFVKRTETSRKDQYQIVGVYWMNDSTPFVDWYFDVMKAQTGSAGVLLLAF
jgi:hypothetical protein